MKAKRLEMDSLLRVALAQRKLPMSAAKQQRLPVSAAQDLPAVVAVAQPQVKPREHFLPAPQPAFLLQPARVYRCWTDRDPFVPDQALLADQKDNRAARSGVRPICDRYRRKRNRDGVAGCDNKYSRSPRKCDGPVPPCPISAPDKRLFALHPSAD